MPKTPSSRAPMLAVLGTGLLLSATATSAPSHIQSNQIGVKPAPIEMGAISVIPQISTNFSYDDNLFSSSTREKSTWIWSVIPSVLLEARDHNNHRYALNYEFEDRNYVSSRADDAQRHQATAEINLEANIRNRLDLTAGYHDTFEPRGTRFSEGTTASSLNEPDDYTVKDFGAKYTYGLPIASRLSVWANKSDTSYDTRRTVTAVQDRENESFGAGFYWAISPITDLILEYNHTDIDYPTDRAVSLDSEQDRVWVGASWAITGKTVGEVKAGRVWKDFDATAREDSELTSASVSIDWFPMTYAQLTLTAGRDYSETTGNGNAIKGSDLGVSYSHLWSDRFKTSLSVSRGSDDYEAGSRDDDRERFSIGADYQFRRWLTFGVQAYRDSRDSNLTGLDYDKNVFAFTITGSL